MLYTGKGDDGKTKFFCCDQRLTKSSLVAEALGAVDEINSFLGWCKVKVGQEAKLKNLGEEEIKEIIEEIQNGLFSVQAELASASKFVSTELVEKMEKEISLVEKEIPAVKSFVMAGGSELSAMFDYGRTIARRAERMVVRVNDQKELVLRPETLAFMNRLSSLLYALARLANSRLGVQEISPKYEK